MSNIKTLDWFITTKCNEHCGFCYAPSTLDEPYETYESLEFYLKICDYIQQVGFKIVGICGGEPTEFPYLREIICYLYSKGIGVSLYTNCDQIDIVKDVIDYLYSISIPLDSITYIPQMRNERHFKNLSNVLNFLENNSKFHEIIKIGTVVTKINAYEIHKIQKFIEGYKKINVWKLYQYSPGGKCKTLSTQYEIDDETFKKVTAKISIPGKKIILRTREETKGYCVLMSQKGNFYLYNEDYIPTGTNILYNSLNEITSLYNSEINNEQKDWRML